MCNHCQKSDRIPRTRREFIGRAATGLTLAVGLLWSRRLFGQTAPPPGSKTGWARLITPSPYWNLHGEQDQPIADFIRRETHLNLDSTSYTVDPSNLDELAAYPFIFTNDLVAVKDAHQQANLQEYLRRGGFIYIDGCLDHRANRSFTKFMSDHAALFAQLLPGSDIRRLTPNHPIFQAYSPIQESNLSPVQVAPDDLRWKGAPQALYGVYQKNRMVSLISLDHLQCEWLTKPDKVPFCLRQIANIYVYAMTR